MDEDILIPFVVFGSIALMVIANFHYSYKKRMSIHDTIKAAIDKTGTVDAALIDSIARDNIGPNGDLRRGIILLSIALAFGFLGFMVPAGEHALKPMLGVASFPGFVGLSYIAFHFFAPREPTV